ncbi:hypothetical protein KSP40_PGU007457 [Platanthera guangdongensis]|uniref:Uncharacterized protein n=1 Tax=Platanthera guangdongensis TaxID=2320717 RepID=A0ABR2LXV8_9ASPA
MRSCFTMWPLNSTVGSLHVGIFTINIYYIIFWDIDDRVRQVGGEENDGEAVEDMGKTEVALEEIKIPLHRMEKPAKYRSTPSARLDDLDSGARGGALAGAERVVELVGGVRTERLLQESVQSDCWRARRTTGLATIYRPPGRKEAPPKGGGLGAESGRMGGNSATHPGREGGRPLLRRRQRPCGGSGHAGRRGADQAKRRGG